MFTGVAIAAWLLLWPSLVPFTAGALACAMLFGLGNGAVFKLVPEHFPKEIGTVTGLVGALGGLGGFFPPLLLGWGQNTDNLHGPNEHFSLADFHRGIKSSAALWEELGRGVSAEG